MSCQLSLLDTDNAISSPALADGPTPSGSPAFPTTTRSGPEVALASLSARQAKEMGLLTSGTSGRRSITSSASAALQSSLVSRLQAALRDRGSTLFKLTWKPWVTPAGRRLSRLAASAHRTSDSDCIGWHTPVANDDNKSVEAHLAMKERMGGGRKAITSLQVEAKLSAWPTPNTPSGGRSVSIEKMDATGRTSDGKKHTASLEHAAKFACWKTPRAKEDNDRQSKNGVDFITLQGQAKLASWATPTTRDHKDGASEGTAPINALLGRQVWMASGETPNGSGAGTGSIGQLNPEHSRWLMGYPTEWSSCADTAMQSFQSRPQRSSKRA